MIDLKPVDLAAPPPAVPTDWKVLYGDRHQHAAYFQDRAKAEQFAVTHHGIVVALGPV